MQYVCQETSSNHVKPSFSYDSANYQVSKSLTQALHTNRIRYMIHLFVNLSESDSDNDIDDKNGCIEIVDDDDNDSDDCDNSDHDNK